MTPKQTLIDKAKAGDVTAQWQLAIQRDPTSEASSEPVALSLIPPRRRLLPRFERSLRLVDDKLLAVFRRLILGEASWPLYLRGPAGCGKTAATLALCDCVENAVYVTVDDLADSIMSQSPVETREMWDDIAEADLVVLDELGTRRNINDLAYRVTSKFCDLREQHGRRRAIYISNLDTASLHGLFDDRVLSRVSCGEKFHLVADDRRRAQ